MEIAIHSIQTIHSIHSVQRAVSTIHSIQNDTKTIQAIFPENDPKESQYQSVMTFQGKKLYRL